MAGVWKGFTEEDIESSQKKEKGNNGKVKKSSNSNEGDESREKIIKQHHKQNLSIKNKNLENAKPCGDLSETVPLINNKNDEKAVDGCPSVMATNPVCLKVIEGKAYELVDKNPTEVSKATLEIFEARQKMLEEQNKRRKEMLAKIISARKKQTSEEAKRLQNVQEELQKLDLLLSNDVGILRNKIEEASLDFAEAQKRYNKAEKEFLDAKQNLFGKLEKKELLTKLLCTIIEQNELRKAQKLSELMEKLEINEMGLDGSPTVSTAEILKSSKGAHEDRIHTTSSPKVEHPS